METSYSTLVAAPFSMRRRLGICGDLCKARLSFFVALSSCWGYLWCAGWHDLWTNWKTLLGVAVGGFMVAAAASALNQIAEKKWDARMKRTQNRPIPSGRIKPQSALKIATALGMGGLCILYASAYSGWACVYAAGSLVIYVGLYTPLKRIGSVAVAVGALPGALPPFIGWIAAGGSPMAPQVWWLFAIQFIWQFPHFWAIALLAKHDYKRAGFQLLPHPLSPTRSALHACLYTLCLWPLALLPSYFKWTGNLYATGVSAISIYFIFTTFKLVQTPSAHRAKQVMFASFFYLTTLQILSLVDKH